MSVAIEKKALIDAMIKVGADVMPVEIYELVSPRRVGCKVLQDEEFIIERVMADLIEDEIVVEHSDGYMLVK